MNITQLKKDIFNPDNPKKQYGAAYQMRYVKNNSEVIYILFSACYEAKDPKLQQEAVKSLGILKPEKALDAFIKSTHNPDMDKRRRAYYHLGTLGNSKAVDVVLNGLTDSDKRVRRAAAISAGRLGNNYRAINALKQLLNEFESSDVQQAAKTSISIIEQKIGEKRKFNNKPSFNKTKDTGKFNHSKSDRTNYASKSYTPKGF